MANIRVRFIREGKVERPPRDPGKGGYEIDRIPVGTVREMKPSSVNFWLDRGCIEVLGPGKAEPEPFNPFAVPVVTADKPKKTEVRAAIMNAFAVLSDGKADLKPVEEIDKTTFETAFAKVVRFAPSIADYLNGACAHELGVLTEDIAAYSAIHDALGKIIMTLWPKKS